MQPRVTYFVDEYPKISHSFIRREISALEEQGLEIQRIAASAAFRGTDAKEFPILFQARQAQSLTYNPTPIVLAALIYFVMLLPLVRLLSRLENRALARA